MIFYFYRKIIYSKVNLLHRKNIKKRSMIYFLCKTLMHFNVAYLLQCIQNYYVAPLMKVLTHFLSLSTEI